MLLAAPQSRKRIHLSVVDWSIDPQLHKLCIATDCVERRSELVAHDSQELRLHRIRLLGLDPCRLGRGSGSALGVIEPGAFHGQCALVGDRCDERSRVRIDRAFGIPEKEYGPEYA